MGKQSARLYYQGKDHKDICYNGLYHNAMMYNGEVVWRKLRDEEYYALNTYYSLTYSPIYQEAIVYPQKRVMSIYNPTYMVYFAHNDKMAFGNYSETPALPKSRTVIASKDAKLFRKIELTDFISGGVVPVRDGFLYTKQNTSKYAYVRICDDGTFEENEIESETFTYPRTAYIGGECPDGVAINSNGGCAIWRTNGTISPVLDGVSSNIIGYGNGGYILLQSIREDGYVYNTYAWSIRPNHTWRRYTTPMSYYYSAKILSMLYRNGKFIIYLLAQPSSAENERLRIWETEDFKKFKEIPVLAKKLSIEYINQESSRYTHIDLILDSSALEEEGHYRCTSFSINNNIFFKNQKKTDSSGLVFYIRGYELSGFINTTVYIDNLYFEESDKSFAVYDVVDVGDINEVG